MPKTDRNPQDNVEQVRAYMDSVIEEYRLKNDAALGRFTGLSAPILSKLRYARFNFNHQHLVHFHIATGIPVKDIMSRVGMTLKSTPAE